MQGKGQTALSRKMRDVSEEQSLMQGKKFHPDKKATD